MLNAMRPHRGRIAYCIVGTLSASDDALRFRRMCGDEIHDARGQAIIGLQSKLFQPGSDGAHVFRVGPDSMMDETNAANSAGAQPGSDDSSV